MKTLSNMILAAAAAVALVSAVAFQPKPEPTTPVAAVFDDPVPQPNCPDFPEPCQ